MLQNLTKYHVFEYMTKTPVTHEVLKYSSEPQPDFFSVLQNTPSLSVLWPAILSSSIRITYVLHIMRLDSLPRLWRYINLLLTYKPLLSVDVGFYNFSGSSYTLVWEYAVSKMHHFPVPMPHCMDLRNYLFARSTVVDMAVCNYKSYVRPHGTGPRLRRAICRNTARYIAATVPLLFHQDATRSPSIVVRTTRHWDSVNRLRLAGLSL